MDNLDKMKVKKFINFSTGWVNYNGKNFFYTINKNAYHLEELGQYEVGKKVSVYYQGIEVFSQVLTEDSSEFRRKNKLERANKVSNRRFNINFIDGPFIEILLKG